MKATTADRIKTLAIKEYDQGGMKYAELQALAHELNDAVRGTKPEDR